MRRKRWCAATEIDSLPAAAGLGRLEDARRLLPTSGAEVAHRALALSAQDGDVEILRPLPGRRRRPQRLNPEGRHQALCHVRGDVVRLLVVRDALLDIAVTSCTARRFDGPFTANGRTSQSICASSRNDKV